MAFMFISTYNDLNQFSDTKAIKIDLYGNRKRLKYAKNKRKLMKILLCN